MKNKTVVLDVDGCLLQFTDAYIRFVRGRGYSQVVHSGIKSYFFLRDFGVDKTESKKLFDEFTDSGGFKNLWPYPGANAVFDFLRENGCRIVLATDVPTRAQNHREQNLASLGLEYNIAKYGPDKSKVVLEEDAPLVLEDNPTHIEDLLNRTDAIVCMPEWPYNRHLSHKRLLNLGPPDNALSQLASFLVSFLN